jgi:valacyclovir hydrolase
VVGFSDGGEVALLIGAFQPSAVRSIVTWGSGGYIEIQDEMLDAFANVVDAPIEPMQGFSEHLKARYGEANARTSIQNFVQAIRGIIAAGGDISRSRAKDITCPVLLITGEHDFFAPPALVAETTRALPDATFVEVKGAEHSIQATHPELLVETIVGWLSQR